MNNVLLKMIVTDLKQYPTLLIKLMIFLNLKTVKINVNIL